MHLTFVQLRSYVADARRLGLSDDDQRMIEQVLLVRPTAGSIMPGTGGLRKMRHAPLSRAGGKSGGIRIGYAYFPRVAHVYFIVAFAKSEQANLNDKQKAATRALIAEIESYLARTVL
jgi:hypothetical protein